MEVTKKNANTHPNHSHLSYHNWSKDLGNDSNQADQNCAIEILKTRSGYGFPHVQGQLLSSGEAGKGPGNRISHHVDKAGQLRKTRVTRNDMQGPEKPAPQVIWIPTSRWQFGEKMHRKPLAQYLTWSI